MRPVMILMIGCLFLAFCTSIHVPCEDDEVLCDLNDNESNKWMKNSTLGSRLNPTDSSINREQNVGANDFRTISPCESETKIFLKVPTAAQTSVGVWKELDEKQQDLVLPITLERCSAVKRPCQNILNLLRGSIETKCVQKYIELNIKLKDLNSTDAIRIPSACVCTLKSYYFPNNRVVQKYKRKF